MEAIKSQKQILFIFIFVFNLCAIFTVQADQFIEGDIFAGVGNGLIKRFDAEGNLLAVLDTTSGSREESGMCFDSAGINIFRV